MTKAQQAQKIIEETIEIMKAYTAKTIEIKALLEDGEVNREQLPQTSKSSVDCKYTFDDGSRILVRFDVKGKKVSGVAGSKIED